MSSRRIACARFARLSREAGDRDLSRLERAFVDRHRESCSECQAEEESAGMALNMLRGLAYQEEDLDLSPTFNDRIIRQVKVNTVRDGIRYWSPAAFGALVAMCALFAAMHVAATPTRMKEAYVPGGQARNSEPRPYPNLELERIPELKR